MRALRYTDHTMPYTPGYSSTSVNFMRRRSLATHGDFFVPFLTKGMQVLDCGCGPGKMTVEIARRTAPGDVVGFDMETSQTAAAAAEASAEGLGLRFEQGSVYSLRPGVFSCSVRAPVAAGGGARGTDARSAAGRLDRVAESGLGRISDASGDIGAGFVL
mgnify:CR=1 FL=1